MRIRETRTDRYIYQHKVILTILFNIFRLAITPLAWERMAATQQSKDKPDNLKD